MLRIVTLQKTGNGDYIGTLWCNENGDCCLFALGPTHFWIASDNGQWVHPNDETDYEETRIGIQNRINHIHSNATGKRVGDAPWV